MSNNRRIIMIGLGIIVLLVCLIFGAGSYLYRQKLLAVLGLAPSLQVAHMLPAETQFYMSVTPNLQNAPGYQNLQKVYFDNPDIQALLDEFQQKMKGETDITYEADIKPWLGTEVVLAMPDLADLAKTQTGTSTSTPAFLMAAQTSNKQASDSFINKVLAEAAKKDNPFADETYQGVTLHSRREFILTTFNDFVVASTSDALVKDIIARAQGNKTPSLAESERFKKITGALPTNAVTTLYVEFPKLFESLIQGSAFKLPPEQVKNLEAFEAMGMVGSLQSNGIQFDTVLSYNVEKMNDTMKAALKRPAAANTVLADIPAQALFFFNSQDLNLSWQQLQQSLAANPDFKEQMQTMEKSLGFNFEKDVFSWMTGEYALVLLKVKAADKYSSPVGGYALIGAQDVNQAREHVKKVFGAMEKEAMGPPLQAQKVAGLDMQAMTDRIGTFQGGYGFYKDYLLLAYHEDAVKAVAAAGQNPVTNNPNFKTVQSRLPGSNYGYFYADVDQIQQIIEGQLSDFERKDYEKKTRPILKPIHALGIAANTAGVEQGLVKGVFFVLISE